MFSLEDWAFSAYDAERLARVVEGKAQENPKNTNLVARAKSYREEAEERWNDFWGGDKKYIDLSKKLMSDGGTFDDLMALVDKRDSAPFAN